MYGRRFDYAIEFGIRTGAKRWTSAAVLALCRPSCPVHRHPRPLPRGALCESIAYYHRGRDKIWLNLKRKRGALESQPLCTSLGEISPIRVERERERERLDRHRLRRRGTLLFRSLPDIERTWCPRIPDPSRISARVTLIRAPITNCRDSPVSRKRDDSFDYSRVYIYGSEGAESTTIGFPFVKNRNAFGAKWRADVGKTSLLGA